MTYYIYIKPDTNSYVTQESLEGNPFFQDYVLWGTSETDPNMNSMRYVDGQWVSNELPAYISQRANAYPHLGDQLDMFWHAMDDGVIPKIEPFYTDIKTVKETYPKT